MTFERAPAVSPAGAHPSRPPAPPAAKATDVAELFQAHHLSRRLPHRRGRPAGAAPAGRAKHRRHRGSSAPPDDLLAYARAALVNACRTVLRRRALTRRFTEPPVPVWSAENDVVIAEDRRRVLRALARLAPRQREAIVLRYYLDLPEAEIASAMGVGVGTVKSTLSRGLTALRARYEEEQ
ncbi:sigma-70 family RNA polymerase sigma factor [Actinomadura opuntiae]|uniref:sigma-70 family RNA polymerase sigma factor n=1 Tax=Actinomadura sp. OS1-43 TaxID=604315 RepID=UPI00255AEC31|nr:sigma-70 family RNA polymerase sigma factor [Actinomadura sp. OS1-43]MDL4821021.1 sigma-70 family RNA polymerase sigma factor [Actinomadura sp. OS1-43]